MLNLRKVENLIFDLDGVILSSVQNHLYAWSKAFMHFGIDFQKQDYEKLCDGIPRNVAIKNVLNYFNLEYNEILSNKIAEVKNNFFLESIRLNAPIVFEDFRRFISQDTIKSKKLFVCSSSTMAILLLDLSELSHRFEFIVDGNLTKKLKMLPKPAPDPYLYIVNKFNLNLYSTLAFEDSYAGVQSIMSAKIHCIWMNRADLADTNYTKNLNKYKTFDDFSKSLGL